jgi:hypothetical protein
VVTTESKPLHTSESVRLPRIKSRHAGWTFGLRLVGKELHLERVKLHLHTLPQLILTHQVERGQAACVIVHVQASEGDLSKTGLEARPSRPGGLPGAARIILGCCGPPREDLRGRYRSGSSG